MTCLKYGQCHYWFNLNRPLVIVPCCGWPWMLKWLMWLKNSVGKINPACFEKITTCKTGQVDIWFKHRWWSFAIDFWIIKTSPYEWFVQCCHTSSILHHYDCNHEMNHFEDELRRSLHLSFLLFPRSISLSVVKWGKTCLVSTINLNNKLSES